MSGGEGGIPYNPPRRKLVVHYARVPVIDPPMCRTTSGHYQTSTQPAQVTCVDCKRLMICEHADDECFGTVTNGRCFRHTDEGDGYGQVTQRMIDEGGRYQL